MRFFIACVTAVALVLVAPRAHAQRWSWQLPESGCATFYVDEQPPIVLSEHDFGDLEEFCFRYFSVLHSTDTRGAIWSAMFLTRRMALGGDCITRSGSFRVQPGLRREDRASASDYAGHGADWEIGHMTPADDMPTKATQRQTFVFSNAVPQASELNAPTWAALENQIHNLAEDVSGGLYVVTGPVYGNQPIRRLSGRVGIPTHVFKAVYDPAGERATAFVAVNRHDADIEQISLNDLEEDYGVVAFPSLPESVRSQAAAWELAPRRNRQCIR
jgi:endonuclease G